MKTEMKSSDNLNVSYVIIRQSKKEIYKNIYLDRVHEGKRKYLCTKCNEGFNEKNQLTNPVPYILGELRYITASGG